MSRRDTQLLIEDILEAANRILTYTRDLSFEDFTADQKTVDAVARNFEIIGEAASRLPEEFKSKHPDINWIRITGLRNRIIHEYFGVDYSLVWKIKLDYIPHLISALEKI
jgi:uncharacterized protein with HEPN domain